MKKMIYTLFVIALVASSSAYAAKVTTVALSYQDNQTVARIDVDGPIRFAHQTEIPKEGRGHRVILDVLAATHGLSAKVFDKLPECPITSIRTSQYSVDPEKVVRIVFDMTKAPLYRVEQKGNALYVYFTDKSVKPFVNWSSTTVIPATLIAAPTPVTAGVTPKPATIVAAKPATTDEQRKMAENDRMASLGSPKTAVTTPVKPATPAVEQKPMAKAEPATSKPTTVSEKPTVSSAVPATPKAAVPTTVAQKPAVVEVTKTEPKPMVPATPKADPKPMTPATVATAKPAEPKPATPMAQPTPATKPAVVATTTPTVKKETVPTAAAPTLAAKPATVASTPIAPAPVKPMAVAASPTEKQNITPKSEPATPKPAVVASAPAVPPAKPTETKAVTPVTLAAKPLATPVVAAAKPAATPVIAQQQIPTTPKPEVKPTPIPVPAGPSAIPKPASAPAATVAAAKPTDKPTVSDKVAIPSPAYGADTIAEEDLMVAVDPNAPADEEDELMESDMTDRPNDTSSTARFRRNPAQAAKFKGTMIAEFPKRLVIKYQSKGHRDPFATLIDESRTTSRPTEKAVPNVDGLRLVGIIEAKGMNGDRALFEDKDGFSYILESGDKVQKGYVLRIEDNTVYFQIFEYGWTRTVALKMEEI